MFVAGQDNPLPAAGPSATMGSGYMCRDTSATPELEGASAVGSHSADCGGKAMAKCRWHSQSEHLAFATCVGSRAAASSASDTNSARSKGEPTLGNAQTAALEAGIAAAVSAMAGEAEFANRSETAFALLRRGCCQCSRLPGGNKALGAVGREEKAVVVSFLARVARRRSAERQVRELGAVLLGSGSSAWLRLVRAAAADSSPLHKLLATEIEAAERQAHERRRRTHPQTLQCQQQQPQQLPLYTSRWSTGLEVDRTKADYVELADSDDEEEWEDQREEILEGSIARCHGHAWTGPMQSLSRNRSPNAMLRSPPVPPCHGARIFLREVATQRFLTVTEVLGVECCVMTELPASLFICHWRVEGVQTGGESVGAAARPCSSAALLGFAHEGVPGLGRFLGLRRPWRRRQLRDALASRGAGDLEACCASRHLGETESFFWQGSGAPLQHISSGLWLYVDAEQPEKVLLRPDGESCWEALPTT